MESNADKPPIKISQRRVSRRDLLKFGGAVAVGAGASYIAHKLGIVDSEKPAGINEIPLPEFEQPAYDQSVTVVLLKDTNTDQLYPKDKVVSMMEDASSFYEANSYGKLRFSSKVVDWQTQTSPLEPTNLEEIEQLGNRAIESLGHESGPNSTRVYFVDRRGKKIDVGGRGQKSAPFNRIWINAEFADTDAKQIKHELGHALGLGHVDFVSSKFTSGTPEFELSFDDFTNNLSVDPAGGTADIMGRGDGYFCAPHKVALGWIKDDQVRTISTNGTFELSPIERPEGETLVLRIPKTDTGDFYYIEYRKPDSREGATEPGLYFYMWDEKVGSNVRQFYIRPGHRNVKEKQQMFDKINGVRIKVLRQNEKAELQVSFEPKKP